MPSHTLLILALGTGLAFAPWRAAPGSPVGDAALSATNHPVLIAKTASADRTVSADVSLRSAYVSRGEINSDQPVLQPQVEISKFGFNAGIWANDELTDRAIGRRGFSEIDLMLNYEFPLKPVNLIAGIIEYEYPGATTETLADGKINEGSDPATREFFLVATWDNSWLTPCVEIYYDFAEADGFYVAGMLEHKSAMAPGWTLTPGVSSGWGSQSFNDYAFDTDLSALLDGNLYAKLEYALKNGVKFGADIAYTWLWNGDIRSNAGRIYMGDRLLHGGVTLTYDF